MATVSTKKSFNQMTNQEKLL